MPIYLYEHTEESCDQGKEFEHVQAMKDDKLTACPHCGRPVRRLISPGVGYARPKTDGDLKQMGFTKLVRRDKGVYENVTALDGESKVWEADKPETMPDIRKRIDD